MRGGSHAEILIGCSALQAQLATEGAHQLPPADATAANASSEEEEGERDEVGNMLKAAVKDLDSALQVKTFRIMIYSE